MSSISILVLRPLRDRLQIGIRYWKAYRNFPSVALARVAGGFPTKATLRRSEQTVTLRTPDEAYYVSWYESLGWRYDLTSNVVYVPSVKMLTFNGGLTGGDLAGVFATGIYNSLDVRGRVVIDVGASIGDSAIYFAIRGAERVYAFEPDPIAYDYAVSNVNDNGFSGLVAPIKLGLGAEGPSFRVRGTRESSSGEPRPSQRTLWFTSLDEIVANYGVHDGVLKMDCEGQEYLALAASPNALRHFQMIQVEYHRGLKALPQLLTQAGFDIRILPRSRSIGEILGWRG